MFAATAPLNTASIAAISAAAPAPAPAAAPPEKEYRRDERFKEVLLRLLPPVGFDLIRAYCGTFLLLPFALLVGRLLVPLNVRLLICIFIIDFNYFNYIKLLYFIFIYLFFIVTKKVNIFTTQLHF
jgi:hypothetical protein